MKKLLLTAAALFVIASAGATSARGADMPPSMPMPRSAALVPFFSWNGAYLGINAGYGFGRSNWTDSVTGIAHGSPFARCMSSTEAS